eukprot:53824_1
MGNGFCNCSDSKPKDAYLERALFVEEKTKVDQIHIQQNREPNETMHSPKENVNVLELEDRKELSTSEGEDQEQSHSNEISFFSIESNISEYYIPSHVNHPLFDNWTRVSLEWYKIDKMNELSHFIRCHMQQRTETGQTDVIWGRFDVNKRDKYNIIFSQLAKKKLIQVVGTIFLGQMS